MRKYLVFLIFFLMINHAFAQGDLKQEIKPSDSLSMK